MKKSLWLIIAVISLLTSVGATQTDAIKQLLRGHQYQEALVQSKNMYDADKKDPSIRFSYALALIHNESYELAIELLKQLIVDYPKLPEPYNNLAVIYAQNGLYDESSKYVQLALKHSPNYKLALENLSILQVLKKQETESVVKENVPLQEAKLIPKEVVVIEKIEPAATIKIEPAKEIDSPKVNKLSNKTELTPKELSSKEQQIYKEQINTAIQNWIKSWSNKDLDSYFNMYSDDYVPPKNMSRENWVKQRKSRILNKENIRIDILDVVVEVGSPVAAVATFQQNYRSKVLNENSNKMLVFIRDNVDSTWKIVEERTSY